VTLPSIYSERRYERERERIKSRSEKQTDRRTLRGRQRPADHRLAVIADGAG